MYYTISYMPGVYGRLLSVPVGYSRSQSVIRAVISCVEAEVLPDGETLRGSVSFVDNIGVLW